MSDCLICGAFAPDDRETGYRADSLCPRCQEEVDNWQICDAANNPPEPSPQPEGEWPRETFRYADFEVSAQGDGDPGYRRRCGWCGTVLSEGSEPETTGICEPCYQQQIKNLETVGHTAR